MPRPLQFAAGLRLGLRHHPIDGVHRLIALGQFEDGFTRSGHGGDEGQMHRRAGFDISGHLQRNDRIERETGRCGVRPHRADRLALGSSSPDVRGAVRLEAVESNVRIVSDEPMEHAPVVVRPDSAAGARRGFRRVPG